MLVGVSFNHMWQKEIAATLFGIKTNFLIVKTILLTVLYSWFALSEFTLLCRVKAWVRPVS